MSKKGESRENKRAASDALARAKLLEIAERIYTQFEN